MIWRADRMGMCAFAVIHKQPPANPKQPYAAADQNLQDNVQSTRKWDLAEIVCCAEHQIASSKIMLATFSPIMMQGALVFPLVMIGMIDASATRKPSIP